VVREPLDMFGESLRVETFDGADDARVERPTGFEPATSSLGNRVSRSTNYPTLYSPLPAVLLPQECSTTLYPILPTLRQNHGRVSRQLTVHCISGPCLFHESPARSASKDNALHFRRIDSHCSAAYFKDECIERVFESPHRVHGERFASHFDEKCLRP